MNRTVSAGLALAISIALSFPGPVNAAVNCGDVVTGEEVMTADLVCAADNPAFTINGGRVDMAGHRVSGCLGDGILLIGSGAELENGTVDGCAIAIRLEGAGGHKLSNVVASDSLTDGIQVTSNGNHLHDTSAVSNTSLGYDLTGDENKLVGNTASNNGAAGFQVNGAGNNLSTNFATSNTGAGFAITGAGNKLSRNTAESSGGINISITGNGNKLSQNIAIRSTFDPGIVVDGNENKLNKNISSNNGNGNDSGIEITGDQNRSSNDISHFNTDHGFEITGNENYVNKCRAIDNAGSGVDVMSGAEGVIKGCRLEKNTVDGVRLRSGVATTSVSKNVALENSGFDLDDDNMDCGSNAWNDNLFTTADPPACAH